MRPNTPRKDAGHEIWVEFFAMLRKKLFAVLLLLVWSLASLAGQWVVDESPCCYLIHPAELSVEPERIQEIYTQVRDLWVPEDISLAEIVAAWLEAVNVATTGLIPSRRVEERVIVILYGDCEKFWCDVNYFGVAGLFYSLPPRDVLEDPLAAYDSYENASPVLGLIAVCSAFGHGEAALSHEFTHFIQFVFGVQVPDIGLDPDLIVEGMARWAEHALGYRRPIEKELERQMAAIWASEVDEFSHVPRFVVYELGATLIDRLSTRLRPQEILGLFATGFPGEEIPAEEFHPVFPGAYGELWEEFMKEWISGLRATEVTPQGELLYEYRRLGITLRTSFLWPLLSPEDLGELEALNEAFYAGEASLEDLSRAEEILAHAWREPNEELLASLERRQKSLKHWARVISGPEAEARVARLNIIRVTASPAEYVHEFVDLVNRFLIFQVPSPVKTPVG